MPGCDWIGEPGVQWALCLFWLLAVSAFQVLPGGNRREGGRS